MGTKVLAKRAQLLLEQMSNPLAPVMGDVNAYLKDSIAIIQPFFLRLIYFCLDKIGTLENASVQKTHMGIFNALKKRDPYETQHYTLQQLKNFRDLVARTILMQ